MISNHVLRGDIGRWSVRVIIVPARGKVKSGTVRIVMDITKRLCTDITPLVSLPNPFVGHLVQQC